MTSIANLRKYRKVQIVDDERELGNGVIVTLKKGWTFSAGEDNRVRGEDTVTAITKAVNLSLPFAGPYDD